MLSVNGIVMLLYFLLSVALNEYLPWFLKIMGRLHFLVFAIFVNLGQNKWKRNFQNFSKQKSFL